MSIFPNLVGDQAKRGAQFLQMLAKFVHGESTIARRAPGFLQRRLDFFAKNSVQPISKSFSRFYSVAHSGSGWLFSGESDVAVTLDASDLGAEPGRRFEFSA